MLKLAYFLIFRAKNDNTMKISGTGFTYWYNSKQLKDYDAWDKIFRTKENIKTEVKALEMHIYDKKDKDE